MCKIILASASPRRKELLSQIGVDFQVIPSKGEEIITEHAPEQVVMELALQKAKEVAECQRNEECIVIGADTIVALEEEILGKPQNEQDAVRMLSMLQGNTHSVYTGVAVLCTSQKEPLTVFYEQTKVSMYPMSEKEIRAYVATGDCMDKAGSYGIQGICAKYIQGICGDYNNVVGLPVGRLYQECKNVGVNMEEGIDDQTHSI